MTIINSVKQDRIYLLYFCCIVVFLCVILSLVLVYANSKWLSSFSVMLGCSQEFARWCDPGLGPRDGKSPGRVQGRLLVGVWV